jgi:hypothetical protein
MKKVRITQGGLLDRVGYAVAGGGTRGLSFTRDSLTDFMREDDPEAVQDAIDELISRGYLEEFSSGGLHYTYKAYRKWVE